MFNQVEFIHRLEAEGLARGAAEVIAAGIDDGRRDLATKSDIAELRSATKTDIAELRSATKSDIAEFRSATKTDIAELRSATKSDLAELRRATETDIADLRTEIAAAVAPLATKAELKLEVSEALREQTNQLGAMLVGGLAVMTAILGLLVSIK